MFQPTEKVHASALTILGLSFAPHARFVIAGFGLVHITFTHILQGTLLVLWYSQISNDITKKYGKVELETA